MAFTPEKINRILNWIDSQADRIEMSKKLFTINEGELMPYVLEALSKELDPKAYARASKRAAPINVLPKMIDKLSTLYTKDVAREVEEGSAPVNQDITDWYVKEMGLDPKMVCSQKQFNLNKYTALEPYIEERDDGLWQPKMRILPAHTFMVYTENRMDRTKVEVFIKILGTFIKETGEIDKEDNKIVKKVTVYQMFDKDQIIAVDSDGDIRLEFMEGNEEGINPFGKIPFIYINESEFSLLPNPDTDTLPLSVLIPLLLTDLNYATQFMSHSIVYAIDADIANLDGNPDAVWHVKSELKEDGTEGKAQIGTIKPEVDIDKVLKLIETELRMWLDTNNIKAGSIGNLNLENAASGIAKMIDESDTTEARMEQETIYIDVERRMWKLIGLMHNTWLEMGFRFDENRRVIDNLLVNVEYASQEVIEDLEKEIRTIKMKLDSGLTSRRRAIQLANPELDESELDALIEEIEAEKLSGFNIMMPRLETPNEDTSNTDSSSDANSDDNDNTSI